MLRYRLALILLSLPLLLYTAWIAIRERNPRYFRERLGFTGSALRGGVWIHAASVGEVNAVMPLIQLLAERRPDLPISLSCNTPGGALVARKQLPPRAGLHFLPIDWHWATGHFLRGLSPRCALIMETELWPNLYTHCDRLNIPLIIINGRLSPRTMRANAWLRDLYRDCMSGCRAILTRSEQDSGRFIELGAEPDRVTQSIAPKSRNPL